MATITVVSKGDLKKTEAFLQKMNNFDIRPLLESAAQRGVKALASATPEDSGLASDSWGYKISGGKNYTTIVWTNHDVENGFPVAIALQYGYGTGTGGFVQGRDYINPAIQPVMDQIANDVWKAVTSA